MSKEKIKAIWAISKKLNLSDEDIYSILYRETGKESMRECSTKDLDRVLLALRNLQGSSNFNGRASKKQVWKIRDLEQQLGWQDEPKRLASFLRKYYKVEHPEWLTPAQAWRAIESLKKVASKVAIG